MRHPKAHINMIVKTKGNIKTGVELFKLRVSKTNSRQEKPNVLTMPSCMMQCAMRNPKPLSLHPLLLQPSDLFKHSPQLARLIHINLASLLSIRLSELLANLQALLPLDEYASLAREICSTIETEVSCQQ